MRGRRSSWQGQVRGKRFQSTPPCGGDLAEYPGRRRGKYFNPRPHAGATQGRGGRVAGNPDFNPRPHAGATLISNKQTLPKVISIHAPMRGRLYDMMDHRPRGAYFNPRPHAGATTTSEITTRSSRFQSTPPCGGDTYTVAVILGLCISIHAPMRGRPTWAVQKKLYLNDFNPRPHAGATDGSQSGARHYQHFNPRPHAGATMLGYAAAGAPLISIHAPMRGRPIVLFVIRVIKKFQSTPPCGGDGNHPACAISSRIFQSTPPCGGDQLEPGVVPAGQYFNPRPHAGATPSAWGR